MGPDLVRDTSASFFELDEGALAYFDEVDQTVEPDSHVTFVPFYKVLTAVFFETGAMSTPTKLRNVTNCGSGGSFQS